MIYLNIIKTIFKEILSCILCYIESKSYYYISPAPLKDELFLRKNCQKKTFCRYMKIPRIVDTYVAF